MFCVGLTGNIASGKSTAIRYFQDLGVSVISADVISRDLTAANQPALLKIKQHFGDQILTPTGDLNRSRLRQLIFADQKERKWLEALLHPLIRDAIKTQVLQSQGPYCVVEIPLLLNRKDYPYINRILVLLADRNKQTERVMARDQCDKQHALDILAAQPSDSARREIADDLILNHGSIEELNAQIKKLHASYLLLATENQS
jgi:dephospho-CoA kinase